MTSLICSKCSGAIDPSDKFCPHCGSPVDADTTQPGAEADAPQSNRIRSTGTYSGKMTTGSGFFGRLLKIIIGLVIVMGGAIGVWMLVDPDAGKKLHSLMDNIGAVLVVGLFFWIFFKGKGKRRRGGNRGDYDDDWDDGGYDDGDD